MKTAPLHFCAHCTRLSKRPGCKDPECPDRRRAIGRGSRNKGKVAERQAAALLTEAGLEASRAQQFKGNAGSFDLNCPALEAMGFGIEVKAQVRPSFPAWIEKAKETGHTPLILWRKHNDQWYALLPLSALLPLLKGPSDG